MTRARLVSSIYHQANPQPPMGEEAQRRNRLAREAVWHGLGLAVLDPEDIADEWLRQAVINETQRLYGRRGRR